MSWQIKHEHVDKRTGQHVIRLHEPNSGAEHLLQIYLTEEAVLNNPKERIAAEIAALEAAHQRFEDYARKHRVPVKRI